MKKIIKAYLVIISAIVFVSSVSAQQKHELSAYGAVNFASLKTKITNVVDIDNKNKMGGAIGIGYSYSITPSVAILSGVEFAVYNVEFKAKNIAGSYDTSDSEDDAVLLQYTMDQYKETAKASYLNIPLMVQYTYSISPKVGVYAAGGAKIGFAVNGSFKNSYSDLKTIATYTQWGHGTSFPTIDDLPEQGFGEFANGKSDGDISFKMLYSATVEAGLKCAINEKYSLYAGAYFDYAMNNVLKDKGNLFVDYDKVNPSQLVNNSLVTSSYVTGAKPFVSKVTPMAIGVKIRFAYKL